MNTGERLVRVETELKNINTKLDTFIKSADKKYAAKWIEKLNYTAIAAFMVATITKIVGLW